MAGIQRFGLHAELAVKHEVLGDVLWTVITTSVLIGVASILAVCVDSSFVFASLGPIIFQLVERPLAPASSPRSTIIGHTIAVVIGYATLVCFGLLHQSSVFEAGMTTTRALAVVVALPVAGALLVLFDAVHPPAGSTLLLITVGVMRAPVHLLFLLCGVVVVCACGWGVNHLAHVPMPIWRSSPPKRGPGNGFSKLRN